MKLLGALGAVVLLAASGASRAGQIALPIYFEDNHAGAFYWLAQHVDLEERYTLLHFDAHSDASAVFDSDRIRNRLRRVDSLCTRARILEDWRQQGVVQCFAWMEPLMPAPVSRVIWIPPTQLSPDGKTALQVQAGRQLDGQLEAAPRVAGSLGSRYRVMSLEELEADGGITGPLLVSLDLDYFADTPPNERSAAFERIWKFIAERRDLRAITIAISRPFLASDAEAETLLKLALQGALSLPTARIQFEPFRSVGHDRSLRARAYRARNEEVPGFSLTNSSPELRALFLARRDRITVQAETERWKELLESWKKEAPEFRLAVKGHAPSTDRIWRIAATEEAAVEVLANPWTAPFENVQWIVETPVYPRCNLVSTVDDVTMFARGAPPRPRRREIELPVSGKSISLSALRQFFDQESGCGSVRLKARVAGRETLAIELRKFTGTGFRAAISEQFGLPYLFGSGALRDGENNGPETGWGADCANFVVYALRRQGLRVPWSNPKQLRQQLEALHREVSLGDAPNFAADDLQRGLILHLGSHVAALIEDRPPLGVLDASDIVAHQLEGAPKLIAAGALVKSRFDLLRVPATNAPPQFVFGGDVMLGRSVGTKIEAGTNPLAGISEVFRTAEHGIVNLECVASETGQPLNKRYALRAPQAAAEILKATGCDVIGLANNHANDFGPDALLDSIAHFRAAGLGVIGGPNDSYLIVQGVALFGINDVDQPIARPVLAAALQRARSESKSVFALVHWGEENTSLVTERQRELARWLIDHGVDLIVGSHPHCLQPLDFYHGRPIVYSLGNLVFDGAPTVPSWNKGALLEVSGNDSSRSLRLRMIPVQLDANGFPHLKNERALQSVSTR